MTKKLENRIALITGASRGIGRATALAFAKEGAHVIAMARTQGALEELDDAIRAVGGTATLVPADLKDMDSLDRLGPALLERWGKLDIFFGNGAILGPISPLGHIIAKEWDDVMLVNVTANFRLIRILDPLLQRSESGRVILMSSAAAWKRTPVPSSSPDGRCPGLAAQSPIVAGPSSLCPGLARAIQANASGRVDIVN